MTVPIKPRRSHVSSAVPSVAALDDNELAVNTNDRTIYMRVGAAVKAVANYFSGAWADITGKPATATRWPSWSEVSSKPTTFTPSAHGHAWSEISGKPTTFTPSGHSHGFGDIAGTIADGQLPTRLRENAATVTDWDAAVTNGWHMAANAANAPAGGWWIGEVVAHNPNWVTQTVHAFTTDGAPDSKTWRRERNNGAWTAWYRLRLTEAEQGQLWAPAAHSHSWGSITGKPSVVTNGGGVASIRKLTQAQYNALTPDANTLYVIVG